MAKLSPETTEVVNRLKQQSLDILDKGTAAAFHLNERAGETDATLPFFDELQAATEDARNSLSRLHNLQLMAAESQPVVPPDILELLARSIEYTSDRIPALERTIEEVKLEFNLP